ncbi:hypothetical protein [Acaryochloris thomasi]|nr:hypothetical protein [Acaryochloris thomasi]
MQESGEKAMAASDAQKRATKKYVATEQGKEARKKASENYFSSEQGQQKLKEAQQKFESSEARKEYKRQWMKDYYKRKKAEKQR